MTVRGETMPWIRTIIFSILIGMGACTSTPSILPDGGLPELRLDRVEPSIVMSSTWIHIYGAGYVPSNEGSLVVQLDGGGEPWNRVPERIDDTHLRFRMDNLLFGGLGGPGGFTGTLRLRVDYSGGFSQSKEITVGWELVSSLTPSLASFSAASGAGPIYLGSEVRAEGTGFLLDGDGQTELRLTGTFMPDAGGDPVTLTASPVLLPALGRESLQGPFPAEGLGIHPGIFTGDVVPVNVAEGGGEFPGTSLTGVTIELGPTVLNRFEPSSASRGQWIDFFGRGFVAGNARTGIRIDGTFTARGGQVTDYTGANALEIFPAVQAGDRMRYVLRVSPDGHGGVQGLGANAGVLEGTATPIVYLNADQEVGVSLPGQASFTVLPQTQVVYVSLLPGFVDALRLFGLRNMEQAITDRIFEVIRRDYQAYSVDVRSIRPTDFVEYSVVEVGGEDPNQQGLLGLDATMGKDIGNVYFDDIVGGNNADSRENGHYAFGGVFVDSFLAFSPSASQPMPIASQRFDDVFGPFMPSLGGTPVEADEYPGGSRVDKIDLAVHALGSMIGNTVSHEFGHTLGLACGPADFFHNQPPAPNQIMDGGSDRPFEERAEIDGQGPAVWALDDAEYLQQILPR